MNTSNDKIKIVCPFMSTRAHSGSSEIIYVECEEKCALFIDGKCSFKILAENLTDYNKSDLH